MYDHDLRTWYRDLFLLSARRRAATKRWTDATEVWTGHAAEAELAANWLEFQRLRNHERPQATT